MTISVMQAAYAMSESSGCSHEVHEPSRFCVSFNQAQAAAKYNSSLYGSSMQVWSACIRARIPCMRSIALLLTAKRSAKTFAGRVLWLAERKNVRLMPISGYWSGKPMGTPLATFTWRKLRHEPVINGDGL
eukprot:CAMPEP_0198618808 /NCGR_PEP_ID=MMETSP1462-20131121/161079_1 /TAXON_ID=1333877 /ORGANISM="Brandtodinium nutriculum, Strain RCC3387" /LENGTH=130 /DNA_ID=CAMNT_0044350607 /DNA_START=74 /DNA_END=466 /DNA_ORIENTATION=-